MAASVALATIAAALTAWTREANLVVPSATNELLRHVKFLSAAELTGQSRSHVVDLDEPRCSLHREVVLPFLALHMAALGEGIDRPESDFGGEVAALVKST